MQQKTTNVKFFEAVFGRLCNTPISITVTKQDSKCQIYENTTNPYLDEDTTPYLTDAQWADMGMRSDTQIAPVTRAATSRVTKKQAQIEHGEPNIDVVRV